MAAPAPSVMQLLAAKVPISLLFDLVDPELDSGEISRSEQVDAASVLDLGEGEGR